MTPRRIAAIVCCASLVLAGCASKPPNPPSAGPQRFALPVFDEQAAQPKPLVRQQYQQAFEEAQVVLDYEVETTLSRIDGRSCWSFLTGTLSNHSERTLSNRSGLQFRFYQGDTLLFRDLSYPRMNVPPGGRVQIELVQSPLHHKRCPRYDRIEIVVNQVVLHTP